MSTTKKATPKMRAYRYLFTRWHRKRQRARAGGDRGDVLRAAARLEVLFGLLKAAGDPWALRQDRRRGAAPEAED
jgi:hypothetical protein